MHAQALDSLLHNFSYRKSIEEIKGKLGPKITQLKAKVEERIQRVAALRKEHNIDDAALNHLLESALSHQRNMDKMSYSYSISNSSDGGPKEEQRVIGAGAVNFLLTENNLIRSEKDAIARFELIHRNLRPYEEFEYGVAYTVSTFSLSEADLKYLEF